MEQLVLFILLGLGPGALYAGLSQSLVLTFRGSGVINVAAGAMGMWGAYSFYALRQGNLLLPLFYPSIGQPLAVVPAFIVALAECAVLGAVVEFLVFRPVRQQSALAKLVASVGLLLTLQALIVLRFGGQGQTAPNVLSGGVVDLGIDKVPVVRLEMFAIVVVLAVAFLLIYRFSLFGLATRAAQENEGEALLSGLSPRRLSLLNTVLATVVAGGVGILVAPMTQLDPNAITLAVVPALGAALIARFTSFPVAAAGGIGFGVLESLVTYAQSQSWFPQSGGVPMPGVTDLVFFVAIAVILMWRGKSLPDRGTFREIGLPPAPPPQRILRPTLILSGIAVAILLTSPYDFRQALINTMLGVIASLSVVVLAGFVGQVSMAQYAFAGVAGLIVSKLALSAGIGFPWGPIVAVVATTLIGTLVCVPAVRVRGVQLAVLTMAAAVALQSFGMNNPSWGASGGGTPVPPPFLGHLNLGPSGTFFINGGKQPSPLFGLLVLLVAVAAGVGVCQLRRSDLGQRLLAIRSNERAGAAAGISVPSMKFLAFGVSSFLIAVVGVLYAYNFGSMDPSNFSLMATLTLIAFAYIGGITTVKGAVIAGFLTTEGIPSHILERYVGIPVTYQILVGGVLLIFTIATNASGIALAPPPKFTWIKKAFARSPEQAPQHTNDLARTAAGTGVEK